MSRFRSALVTGGTGFIGTALMRSLVANGTEVFCLTRRRLQSPRPGVTMITAENSSEFELLSAVRSLSPEAVFNLAAAGVNPEDRQPGTLIAGNVGFLANLIQALGARPDLKFVHLGTCSEYGPAKQGHKLVEDDPLRPTSPYGAAKVASFLYGRVLAGEAKMRFVELRPFGVFGIGEAQHRLVPYLIAKLRRDDPAELTGGEQTRDLLYIDDVIDALITAAELDSLQPGEAYNVCSGQPVTVRNIAYMVADYLGKPRELLRFGERPYRSDEPMWLVGENRKFREATEWSPKIDLADGIRRMAETAAI